jgi:hypothetical protein
MEDSCGSPMFRSGMMGCFIYICMCALQNISFLNTTVNSVYTVIAYIYSVETYADGCVIGIEGEAKGEWYLRI